MKKEHFFFILTFLFFLFSCSSIYISKISDEQLDELDKYFYEIKKIHMYNIDRSRLFIHLSLNGPPMYTEEYIRQHGDLLIFHNSPHSQQAAHIAFLLDNAKPINIDPEKNIVQTNKIDGDIWTKDSGSVIDIYGINGNVKTTYIMQNGLYVFYEKGKEGIYYKMPKILLDKFFITGEEFLSEYKKITRCRDRIVRQTQ